MKKYTSERQKEAIKYVQRCLEGKIAPFSESIPELTIPSDIKDCIEYLGNSWSIGNLCRIEYKKRDIFSKDYFCKALYLLRNDLRKVLTQYYMLKPKYVTFAKNDKGKYSYISCIIDYSRNGDSKKIVASSLSDLSFYLDLELDMLVNVKSDDRKYEALKSIARFFLEEKKYDARENVYGSSDDKLDRYKINLIIPDDIVECIEENNFPSEYENYKSYHIGKFFDFYLEENDVLTSFKAYRTQCFFERKIIDRLTKRYFMLRGGAMTFIKDDRGYYSYISCKIEYSGDGSSKEIIADSFEDINNQINNEFDIFMREYERNTSIKEKNLLYVLRCLAYLNMKFQITNPVLIVHEDFAECLECREEFHFDYQENKTVMTHLWYFGDTPYLYGVGKDALLSKEAREHHLEEVTNSIRCVLFKYYMLKPGTVTLQKNSRGKYTRFVCTIECSRDGKRKSIIAESVKELSIYMDIEFDMILKGNSYLNKKGEKVLYALKSLEEQKSDSSYLELYNPYVYSDLLFPSDITRYLRCINEKKSYLGPSVIRNWCLGEIEWETEYGENEVLSKASRKIELDSLKWNISKILRSYNMLKPGDVTIEIKGKDIYLSCNIQYTKDDSSKKITAKTLHEFSSRLKIELDLLMKDSEEYLLLKLTDNYWPLMQSLLPSDIVDQLMLKAVRPGKVETLGLLNLLIFGNKNEQEYARSWLFKRFYYNGKLRDKIYEIEEAKRIYEQDLELKNEYFISVLKQKLDQDKLYYSASELTQKICFDSGQFSRVRNKKEKPSKELAIRLGIAFKLSKEELIDFVESAGYLFPADEKDMIIVECLENGIIEYDEIDFKLTEFNEDMSICKYSKKEYTRTKKSKKNDTDKEI